jgi:hypothetical protein
MKIIFFYFNFFSILIHQNNLKNLKINFQKQNNYKKQIASQPIDNP